MIYLLITSLVLTIIEVLVVKYLMCSRYYVRNGLDKRARYVRDSAIEIPIWSIILLFLFNLVSIIRMVALITVFIFFTVASIVCDKEYRSDEDLLIFIFRGDIGSFFRRTI